MSKRRHKRSAVEALLAVQTASVTKYTGTQGRPSLKQFTADLLAEEEESRASKVREQSSLLTQLIDADITAGLDQPSKFLEATTEQISDFSIFENTSPEELRATWRRGLSEFEDSCNEGTLTESGRAKMFSLIRSNPTTDWRQRGSWAQAYVLAQHAELLDESDFVERPEQPEPQAEATLDDIENIDLSSRSGRARAFPILLSAYAAEAQTWADAFFNSITMNFGVNLTTEDFRKIVKVMEERNLSLLSAKSWDTARVVCCNRGVLTNNSILYPIEKLSDLIESVDTTTYQGRQELRRAERQLMNQ